MKDSFPIGLLKGSSCPMSLFQLLEDGRCESTTSQWSWIGVVVVAQPFLMNQQHVHSLLLSQTRPKDACRTTKKFTCTGQRKGKKKKKATYFKTYVATGILETMPIHPIINISHHQVYIAGETNPQDTTPR
jgi:hypothetical protein